MGNYYSGMMNATGVSYLRHHGIMGQKWGVRRWQNEDGSLTPDGRIHYGYSRSRKDIDTEHPDKFEKEYKKYKMLSGTRSLLGGDHRNDRSVQVMKDYQNEVMKKEKYVMSAKNKDDVKSRSRNIASKYLEKYAKAVLEDMGYDSSRKNIEWLNKQYWFGLPSAYSFY